MSTVAFTFQNQGRWKEAEELGVQVVEARKRLLEPEHPDTLISMVNFACTLRLSGQEKASFLLLSDCVRVLSHNFGPSHPDTISSMSTLDK
jgi:hypothetical protein